MRPRCEVTQGHSLEWLTAAHVASEASLANLDEDTRSSFQARLSSLLHRCAVQPNKVARRGASISDVTTTRWDDHSLYDLNRHPHGRGSGARSRIFAEVVDEYFAATYAEEIEVPYDLIHVTCTGYLSPSGAQKLVARRGWGARTRVSHAYQMGCYAAVPAVRMAAAYIAMAASRPWRCDIVHTELCSLHLDPSDHRIEQLVVQSLFGDGLIRYSMTPDDGGTGMLLRSLHERLLPDSATAMTWVGSDWGMKMTLARDVPERLATALPEFVSELYGRAGLSIASMKQSAFAVHPGGPKILDRVRDVLELDSAQLTTSYEVLADHGNMSSATLPYIWMRLVENAQLPRGSLITSLAFGPGLTLCGALFEKR